MERILVILIQYQGFDGGAHKGLYYAKENERNTNIKKVKKSYENKGIRRKHVEPIKKYRIY